jgi:nucleoid-associated protein YgaU
MRRTASTLLICVFGLSLASGCSTMRGWFGGKKSDPYAESYDQTMTAPATSEAAPTYEPLPAYGSPTYGNAGGGRTHTVAKKETLYSIARLYYNGDQTKWRDIYEANRADIADPNRIRVGQKLVIP